MTAAQGSSSREGCEGEREAKARGEQDGKRDRNMSEAQRGGDR